MNIQITDSWLREFIKTKATPKQIGEYLSLCSQSVEKISEADGDLVYDIEITTNRPDCLSVYGIGRELAAVLPRFGIKAILKKIPISKIPKIKEGLPLAVKIAKPDLCPRFTALVYDNIIIKPSPDFVQKRLNQSGIRALNNVIDISNYLMLELGQPMHTFDYDKIRLSRMILRQSKEGEEIVTLDGQRRILKEGVIVIEDGEGRIIDLCGIMGAKNSETDGNTKRVLLFVQTYNPMKIRRACQSLSFRTEAASRFEKGIDPEGVIPAMERATLLFKKWCQAKPASDLFDIYPKPSLVKTVAVTGEKINRIIGVKIDLQEAQNILASLGFKTKIKNESLEAIVPHWRNNDIEIPEDLVEEIARIYGYHNLPNTLPPLTSLNYQSDQTFEWEDKIKDCLKYFGFTETVCYSLVGKKLLKNAESDPQFNLKISNPLTDDLVYLRLSLIPSLLEIIGKNRGKSLRIFEMANLYLSKGGQNLPDEALELTLATTADDYLRLKGILELLLKELGIENFEINQSESYRHALLKSTAGIYIQDLNIGLMGEVRTEVLNNFEINSRVFILDLEVRRLLKFATKNKKFTPLPKYPPIVEDFSFVVPAQTFIGPVLKEIGQINEIIRNAEIVDTYQNIQTIRVTYRSDRGNLSDLEVKSVREKIIKEMGSRHHFLLKEIKS